MSPFLAWVDFHARSRFARSTIPEEKWGTTRSLILKPRIPDSTGKNFPDSRNQILCLHSVRLRKALNSAVHETRDFKMPRRRRQRERQKSNWLNKQNNNSALASRFFVHFITVTARLRREMPNATFYGGRKQATAKFSVSF